MQQHAPAPDVRPRRARRTVRSAVAALALGTVMFTVGAVGLSPGDDGLNPASGPAAQPAARGSIEALRVRVKHLPRDSGAWAALGMAYVQQARTTPDPATYLRAQKALEQSLTVQPDGNANAEIAMGALAAARHDFPTALTWARRATATAPYNAVAYGVLADAYTQLGRYEDSFTAVQRMNDLRPDASALARASYTFELRGNTARARELMQRSLTAAATTGEQSFARVCLSALFLQDGDARGALAQADQGLRTTPGDSALLEARARARTALGDSLGAVRDYEAAIAVAPLPHYLLGLGELQESLGHRVEADTQYELLRAQDAIRRTGNTPADTDAILFEADHGSPERAADMGQEALHTRPFIAVHDAYAWALHQAGRDEEALVQADQALALGTHSALFHYHRAVIHHALGDNAAARDDIQAALRLDPHFHPLHAPVARALLLRIGTTT
ncbi:tetratricopeptide repeat protein [Streptomyces sp. NPDC055808]|uniref:tetratricopeptide repeat protein n=1 Tax=Streptomyces sp. NPDC001828 TaxID=3364615 RepID=UPI003684BB92